MDITIPHSFEPVITLTKWSDPLVEYWGFEPDSLYVERFWLPVLGPTATWLVRRLNYELGNTSDFRGAVDIDLGYVATTMGLSFAAGRNSPFTKAIQRLVMFGIAHSTEDGFALRTMLPAVAGRHARRWPEAFKAEHDTIASNHIKGLQP